MSHKKCQVVVVYELMPEKILSLSDGKRLGRIVPGVRVYENQCTCQPQDGIPSLFFYDTGKRMNMDREGNCRRCGAAAKIDQEFYDPNVAEIVNFRTLKYIDKAFNAMDGAMQTFHATETYYKYSASHQIAAFDNARAALIRKALELATPKTDGKTGLRPAVDMFGVELPGSTNSVVYGESGTLKSLMATAVAVKIAAAGGNVLWIDGENAPGHVPAMARSVAAGLNLDPDKAASGIHVMRSKSLVGDFFDHAEFAAENAVSFVVSDSITSLADGSLNDPGTAKDYFAAIDGICGSVDPPAGSLSIGHVQKAPRKDAKSSVLGTVGWTNTPRLVVNAWPLGQSPDNERRAAFRVTWTNTDQRVGTGFDATARFENERIVLQTDPRSE